MFTRDELYVAFRTEFDEEDASTLASDCAPLMSDSNGIFTISTSTWLFLSLFSDEYAERVERWRRSLQLGNEVEQIWREAQSDLKNKLGRSGQSE